MFHYRKLSDDAAREILGERRWLLAESARQAAAKELGLSEAPSITWLAPCSQGEAHLSDVRPLLGRFRGKEPRRIAVVARSDDDVVRTIGHEMAHARQWADKRYLDVFLKRDGGEQEAEEFERRFVRQFTGRDVAPPRDQIERLRLSLAELRSILTTGGG